MAKAAIEGIEEIPGRCQVLSGDIKVVIDYAHTPYAVENLLKFAESQLRAGQKIISVFGCGGNRDREKRRIMTDTVLRLSNKTIITEDNTRTEDFFSILSDMLEGALQDEKTVVIRNRREAVRAAILSAECGDVVLLIGKGCEEYIIDAHGYRKYSEIDEATEALKLRSVIHGEG